MSEKKTIQKEAQEMRYRYVAVEEQLSNEETSYVSYGISVRCGDEEIAHVSDISTNRAEIERLAELCTAEELAPEHLGDVIEDFLVECSLSLT